jgi:hypothetical protein
VKDFKKFIGVNKHKYELFRIFLKLLKNEKNDLDVENVSMMRIIHIDVNSGKKNLKLN